MTVSDLYLILAPLGKLEMLLLKDILNYGLLDRCEYDFLDPYTHDTVVMDDAVGYSVVDAQKSGHWTKREMLQLFKCMKTKLCPANNHQSGVVFSTVYNLEGLATGHLLFVRVDYDDLLRQWAKGEIL